MKVLRRLWFSAVLVTILGLTASAFAGQVDVTLLNVSYDPTRELYQDYQRRLFQVLDLQNRRQGDDPTVPWRFGKAGQSGH